MTTTLTILRAARELLSDELRWTKNAYARDAAGNMWDGTSKNPPVCWCLAGALTKVAPDGHEGINAFCAAREVLEDIADADDCIETWNDLAHIRHSDVLQLLDEAIAREAAR